MWPFGPSQYVYSLIFTKQFYALKVKTLLGDFFFYFLFKKWIKPKLPKLDIIFSHLQTLKFSCRKWLFKLTLTVQLLSQWLYICFFSSLADFPAKFSSSHCYNNLVNFSHYFLKMHLVLTQEKIRPYLGYSLRLGVINTLMTMIQKLTSYFSGPILTHFYCEWKTFYTNVLISYPNRWICAHLSQTFSH